MNRVEMLKAVTFQKDLGSYHWKTERICAWRGSLPRTGKRRWCGDLTRLRC